MLHESQYSTTSLRKNTISPVYSATLPRKIGQKAAPASSKNIEKERYEFPNWKQVKQALDIAFHDLAEMRGETERLRNNKDLFHLLKILQLFINKNQLTLKEGMGIYRHAQNKWKEIKELAKYMLTNIPQELENYDKTKFIHILELFEFIENIAAAREASMSLGYPLRDQKVHIPAGIDFPI